MANERSYGNNVVHQIPQELTDEDKKYAELYLNETDETRENAVTEIRRWLEDELRIRIGKSDPWFHGLKYYSMKFITVYYFRSNKITIIFNRHRCTC